jgi:signal recognition particle receptor subunit beta
MVQINFAQRQVNAKIVYYGPGMSGKTTNLEIVHQRAPAPNRGDLTSISTDGDRTLFFDFMPLDLGTVAGMRTCFQIYTVPGQVYYNSTRKLVLQGVDGVVFVADSSASMIEENLESMRNLEQNLAEYGKNLANIPLIIQYNKRDLPDAMSVEELNRALNPHNAPFFEAIANTGQGVFPTLKALAARVLETIHTGAKTQAPTLTQTGFHQAAAPQQAAPQQYAPQPAAPQPSIAPQQTAGRPLQQTGFHNAPAAQQQQQRPAAIQLHTPPNAGPALPQLQPMPMAPAPHAQQQQHVPPPMQAAPQYQQQPVHPQQYAQQQYPQQPAPGYGYGGPQPVQPQAQGGQAIAMHQAPPQQPGPLQMMRPGAAAPQGGPAQAARPRTPAPAAQAARPAQPAARPAPAANRQPAAESSPRLQPRAAPLPTPTGGKKRLVYVGVFLAIALGIGAVVAKIVLKLF